MHGLFLFLLLPFSLLYTSLPLLYVVFLLLLLPLFLFFSALCLTYSLHLFLFLPFSLPLHLFASPIWSVPPPASSSFPLLYSSFSPIWPPPIHAFSSYPFYYSSLSHPRPRPLPASSFPFFTGLCLTHMTSSSPCFFFSSLCLFV